MKRPYYSDCERLRLSKLETTQDAHNALKFALYTLLKKPIKQIKKLLNALSKSSQVKPKSSKEIIEHEKLMNEALPLKSRNQVSDIPKVGCTEGQYPDWDRMRKRRELFFKENEIRESAKLCREIKEFKNRKP